MAKRPTSPTRTYRRHGDVPAYFQYRDGRPTWNPSQGLRDAGWRRCDLKTPEGQWMTQGAALDRAAVINDAVALWRAGLAVPNAHAAYAPPGSTETPLAPLRRVAAVDRFSIGALFDGWVGVPDPAAKRGEVKWLIPPSDEFAEKQPSTQRDYRNKLRRLIDTLAGYVKPLDHTATAEERAAYSAAVEAIRAESIFTLQAEEDADGVQDPLYEAYRLLKKHAGIAQSSGVMTVAGVWLNWCRARRSRRIHNWAAEVAKQTPKGRIRVLTWPELEAMVTAAEAKGYPSIADSFILGVDLSWSQADRLALTWDRITHGEDGRLRALTISQLTNGPKAERVGRQKTGRVGGTPFIAFGLRRIALIKARQEDMDAHPTHVLWCETTKAPWKADHYRHIVAEIRAEAVKSVPSCIDVTDQDLRDTGITICRKAGLSIDETCARSLQSRRRVLDLWDESYGEIGPEIAGAGADRLDAWIKTQKVAL